MNALTGLGGLTRLILRRDRLIMPIWVLLLGLIPINFVAAVRELFPTAAERMQYARTSGTNPTFLALYGPLYDEGIGGIVTQRAGFMPVMVALISALTVIRHTRTEEEAGRRELLGATVIGRGAGLAAALVVTMAANLVIAALLMAGMAGQDLPVGGSLAFGLQMALAGCVFAAVAGVTAQLSESAGAARGIAVAALGGAFVVRMASDIGGADSGLNWLGWLTPLGWGVRLRPYADEQWWVLGIFALFIALMVAVAVMLSVRRDLGAGILPPRLGPADAGPGLRGSFGLAWRLHSRPLYAWTAGLAALGVVYGAFAEAVQDMVNDSPELEEIFTRLGGQSGIVDAYFASSMGMLGLITSGYAVSAALKARAEETSLRAEPVLGTATTRLRWTLSHLAFAVLGSAVALAVTGALAGLVYGINIGDVGGQVPRVLGAALAQLPAVWLLAGIAAALFGLAPRLTSAAWGAVALAAVLTLFGMLLDLNQRVLDLSPFTHIPDLPGNDVSLTPLAWLIGLSAVLFAAGLTGFRRRDFPVT